MVPLMYYQTKVKQEVKEVSTARTRLDATLQSLVDKKEDSAESTAESDYDDGPVMVSVPVVRSSGSPAASPMKRAVPRGRKRKRKLDSMDATDAGARYHQTSYVMKLFDRSVDLAQFNDKTPLYPIARAWMKNSAHPDEDEDEEARKEKEEPRDPTFLYKMPLPLRLKIESGPSGDPRIPVPITSDDEPLDIYKDPDLGPAPEELLLNHMARWKTIRESWIHAAQINELKYNNSMTILKDMFEANLPEQPAE